MRDLPFSLDRRPGAGARPRVDALLYVDLEAAAAPGGSALRWVAFLAPGEGEGVPVGVAPYLRGLRVAAERGERPAPGPDVHAYVPGPGEWMPLGR